MGEHNEQLQKVMEHLESTGLKLNTEKCMLRKSELHFLGQVINKDTRDLTQFKCQQSISSPRLKMSKS